MKRITITAATLVTAFAVLIFAGCKKDVTFAPLNGTTPDNFYKSQKDMTAALAGMYSAFQEETTGDGTGKDEGYGGRYFYWGEGRSDNFDRSQYANTTITELSLNAITNANTATDWGGLYKTILRANSAIKYFPQVAQYDNSVTQAITNTDMAQAYAMRAQCYFYIIRLWGDAPLSTTVFEDPNITSVGGKPKTSRNIIMDSVIIPDLKNAYNLIPKGVATPVWYLGESAIASILGDAYMWRATQQGGGQADYVNAMAAYNNVFKAKNTLGAVYGSTGTTLEPIGTWKNIFTAPLISSETIWSINWDYTFNGCACIPVSIQLSNNPVKVDSLFYFSWKKIKTDQRLTKTLDTTATPTSGLGKWDKLLKYYTAANATLLGSASSTALNNNVYLVMNRLSDVYLSYAEALAQTGDLVNALKYLNYIHVRAGLPAFTAAQYPTAATMQDAILQERQYELFGEGKRWFDLVRTNHVNVVMDPVLKLRQFRYGSPVVGFGTDPNKILWPISRAALTANPYLVQNPSY
jgi:tetratricopeptide (TPR) repeat protein